MENKKNDFKYFGGLSVIYGVVFVMCLYENFTGITFPIYVASTIGFSVLILKRVGQSLKRSTIKYFVGMMLLGCSTFITDNFFVHFFNWLGILLLFIAGMIHQFYEDKEWGFIVHLTNLFKFLGIFIISLVTPITHSIKFLKNGQTNMIPTSNHEDEGQDILNSEGANNIALEEQNVILIQNSNSKKQDNKKKPLFMALLGLGAAVLLSFLIVPLLMISDEIFAVFFRNIFQHINVRHLIGISFTFLLGAIPFYSFFFSLFKRNLHQQITERNKRKVDSIAGISFTVVFAVIYLIYAVIQILFLFLRFEGGLPDNVTYYQYAHQGFWQLLAVSLINFIMVLVCIQIFKENILLKSLLLVISICTCIMTVSAVYRMLLYVGAFHLTFLRVLVLWFLGVLTLIMAGVMVYIFRIKFRLFKYVMVVVACSYILFSFARVDFIIARYNLTQTTNLTFQDIRYLTRDLSFDAAPAINSFDLSHIYCTSSGINSLEEIERYNRRILNRNNSGRRWNLSIHLAQISTR